MANGNMFSASQDAVVAGTEAQAIANTGREVKQFFSPGAITDRAEARRMKEASDIALQKQRATKPTEDDLQAMGDLQSQQLENALLQARTANEQLANQSVFSALDRFSTDGNLRHLNNSLGKLRNNPVGKNLPGFSDIVKFQNVTNGDEKLLEPFGVTPQDFRTNPELNQFLVKGITNSGEERVIPMEALHVATGYDQFATDRELTEMERRAEIFSNTQMKHLSGGSELEREAHTETRLNRPSNIPEEEWQPGNPEYDAAWIKNKRQIEEGRDSTSTRPEREAAINAKQKRPVNTPEEEWRPGNPEYDQVYAGELEKVTSRMESTTAQREQQAMRVAKQNIQSIAEADNENFFEIDPSADMQTRLKYEPYIQDITRYGKLEFSVDDRKTITYARELMNLGEIAGEGITEENTGVVDRLMRSVGKYVPGANSENPAITSAYYSFANTLRNAMFGSQLTKTEVKNFDKAFGTLSQQAGPALEQFKTGMTQLRDRLESIVDLNDSYVSHFYLGKTTEELYQTIDAIDERIALFDQGSRGSTGTSGQGSDNLVMPREGETGAQYRNPQNMTPEQRNQELDSMYNEFFGDMQ